jgi:hypothetical protein
MLSALAPSGPVAQAVPSPPSTTDTAQPVQRESFKDVYRSVPTDDQSQNDAGSKPKTANSTDAKAKKSSTGDENDKTVVTAIPTPHGFVFQKAPLTFALPSPGTEVASQPASVESPTPTMGDQPQSPIQSTSDDTAGAAVPNFSLNLTPSKPGPIAATALVAANEKLAFTARLTQTDAATSQGQAPRTSTSQPAGPQPVRPQTSDESRSAMEPTSALVGKDEYQSADTKKAASVDAVLPVREVSASSAVDFRQAPSPAQHAEPASASPARSLAIQDVQPALPEIPKPPASTQILLQLAGQDQSNASVRVVERSGTVNVTVHSADADLRSSLRSNLSDLATQLTGQGFKTEMVKPAVIAANTSNQHDSRQSGREASGQQQHQFTPDGRQPQRDRRANSERWRDELEQETSGTPGAPGGKS